MQLELFSTQVESRKKSPTWDRMTQEERAALIRALARLMMKVIRPETKGVHDE